MSDSLHSRLTDALRAAAHPLTRSDTNYAALLQCIGDRRFVLLGEGSHGTHDFYQERAEITKRLIQERGFTAVAVEADWPDAFRVNRYVRGRSDDPTAGSALRGFRRFPTWMWRNTVVLDFIQWLRDYNHSLTPGVPRVGFYGLDLYSLAASMEAVVSYLDTVDPEAARRARERYSCFEFFGEDVEAYGYATSLGGAESCEDEVVSQLIELQRRAGELSQRDGRVAEDEFFSAEQNARLTMNAEAYYRAMFRGRHESWNVRDHHMAETLEALADHLHQQGTPAKIAVWAHNSHLGDARATEMGHAGEVNVGQLVRERHGHEAALVGFTTYTGTVTAASEWGGSAERKTVRPALSDSYEVLFHQIDFPRSYLCLSEGSDATVLLRKPRLERAIGVIYRPETERYSHYFYARLPEQFDVVLHFDETTAVEPLERTSQWEAGEVPETFPTGI